MSTRSKALILGPSIFLVILLLVGAVAGSNRGDEPYRHLAVFTEVLSRIKSDYVEEPDLDSVTLGAINGLLEAIDPFASYLTAKQFAEYQEKMQAYKADVGLLLSRRFGYIGVVSPLPGSPAARASLYTGDILDGIAGIKTRDMPLAYAQLLLKGDPGTEVELEVLRMRNPEPEVLKLVRETYKEPAIRTKLLTIEGGKRVGYLLLYTLTAEKLKELETEVKKMESQGATHLILDARNCALGDPETGIRAADLFLKDGLISYVKGQRFERKDFQADPAVITNLPLIILTNRGTAGAAEVMAAALQARKRATIVGDRTYGNAAIRRPIRLRDGSAVILSVAKYYTPEDRSIQDEGVTPDVEVQLVEVYTGTRLPVPAFILDPAAPIEAEGDKVIQKALEVASQPEAGSAREGRMRTQANRLAA